MKRNGYSVRLGMKWHGMENLMLTLPLFRDVRVLLSACILLQAWPRRRSCMVIFASLGLLISV